MRSQLWILILCLVLAGCSSPSSNSGYVMRPKYPQQNQIMGLSPVANNVFEKESNGKRVSATLRREPKGLLSLWVRVTNQTGYPVRVAPNQFFVTAYSQYVLPSLNPSQVIEKKYSNRTTQAATDVIGMVPYSDPFGISTAVKALSSGASKSKQRTMQDLTGIVTQGYFKSATIPNGLSAQGFIYYDLSGYATDGQGVPLSVVVQLENEKFEFEFV